MGSPFWLRSFFGRGDFNDAKRNLRGERFRVMVAETSQELQRAARELYCAGWRRNPVQARPAAAPG